MVSRVSVEFSLRKNGKKVCIFAEKTNILLCGKKRRIVIVEKV